MPIFEVAAGVVVIVIGHRMTQNDQHSATNDLAPFLH